MIGPTFRRPRNSPSARVDEVVHAPTPTAALHRALQISKSDPRKYVLTIRTKLSGQTLDRMLSECCGGSFLISLQGFLPSSSGQKKVLCISFERALDRDAFRAALHNLTMPEQDQSEARQPRS